VVRRLTTGERYGRACCRWKKHLTKCQLLQFICMLSQAGWLLHSKCKTFPHRVTEMYLAYIASLFMLFMHFYIRSYRGGAKKVKKA
jgi:hypothetical protein